MQGLVQKSAKSQHCYGSNVPRVRLSMLETKEYPMVQDRDCRMCRPISPIRSNESDFVRSSLSVVLGSRPRAQHCKLWSRSLNVGTEFGNDAGCTTIPCVAGQRVLPEWCHQTDCTL